MGEGFQAQLLLWLGDATVMGPVLAVLGALLLVVVLLYWRGRRDLAQSRDAAAQLARDLAARAEESARQHAATWTPTCFPPVRSPSGKAPAP